MFSAITLENPAKKLATPSSILSFKRLKISLQSTLRSHSVSTPFLSNSMVLKSFSKPSMLNSSFSSIASIISASKFSKKGRN
ncbi:hypothetical protein EPC75_06745 [Helicobacter pylori]|nr:hypothetical protein EPC73_01950 [Helicobacter pylori]KAA6503221.1 hypothetical protein EPC78_06500 [Helicobacter pylori]KAA6517067.1 hypothetical protein EPC75_06745 [Helicobacter pylori]